ncbi:hypothetical protein FIV42_04170 [Persicimonas caeni]|uniref:Uncharacterized protein n=1 Tax=Persicimonas caeni TaxID=2292766 RepID=A0A4Y6PNS2_PERCE|nr:hypothetical protein [Persicimonas caeni]QDG49962.1 hypothetical protein FIV42_04170 [Persicimonas caeni]QED31183.1 hypothetical protein FRD00_04165 [Persicimonas caeni]
MRWRVAATCLLLIAFAALFACGEATDQPEDCRPGEYFDEANELCSACPAVPDPDCRPGCGFFIEDDERGCPVAQCAEECLCESGQFFSDDTLGCESCEEASDPPGICQEQE